MEKHTSPNFPMAKHIIEDFTAADFMTQKHSKELVINDETLQVAHSCFLNIKQLDRDIKQHNNFHCKLEELNRKLVDNIASLKAQAKE